MNTTVIPCLSGMDALSARMSIRYGNLLRDVTARLQSREGKLWRPLMPFILVVLSLTTREPSKVLARNGAGNSAQRRRSWGCFTSSLCRSWFPAGLLHAKRSRTCWATCRMRASTPNAAPSPRRPYLKTSKQYSRQNTLSSKSSSTSTSSSPSATILPG
ncbi:hypothetical protein LXA43DRAFT_97726 [Ganoderma leucocontextum]|nr:hypothetical protein LXA43DRAFT_97726 [Ganoderma leucocontextum]